MKTTRADFSAVVDKYLPNRSSGGYVFVSRDAAMTAAEDLRGIAARGVRVFVTERVIRARNRRLRVYVVTIENNGG